MSGICFKRTQDGGTGDMKVGQELITARSGSVQFLSTLNSPLRLMFPYKEESAWLSAHNDGSAPTMTTPSYAHIHTQAYQLSAGGGRRLLAPFPSSSLNLVSFWPMGNLQYGSHIEVGSVCGVSLWNACTSGTKDAHPQPYYHTHTSQMPATVSRSLLVQFLAHSVALPSPGTSPTLPEESLSQSLRIAHFSPTTTSGSSCSKKLFPSWFLKSQHPLPTPKQSSSFGVFFFLTPKASVTPERAGGGGRDPSITPPHPTELQKIPRLALPCPQEDTATAPDLKHRHTFNPTAVPPRIIPTRVLLHLRES